MILGLIILYVLGHTFCHLQICEDELFIFRYVKMRFHLQICEDEPRYTCMLLPNVTYSASEHSASLVVGI